VLPRRRLATSDDGFTLVEVLFSLTILIILMMASTPFFFSALKASGGQVARQSAVTIANQAIAQVRALGPTARDGSNLLTGRSRADIVVGPNSLETMLAVSGVSPGAAVNSVGSSLDYDPNLLLTGASVNPSVPLSSSTTVNGITYTTRTLIDTCLRPTSASSKCAPLITSVAPSSSMFQITVSVSWPKKAGGSCSVSSTLTTALGVTTCEYRAVTLIDRSTDQIYQAIKPIILSINPTTIGKGVTKTGVSIGGTGFETGAVLSGYSGGCTIASSGTVTNSTTITGVSITTPNTANTICTFKITNPDGGAYAAPAVPVYVGFGTPSISSISLASKVHNTYTTVTLNGANFIPSTIPTITSFQWAQCTQGIFIYTCGSFSAVTNLSSAVTVSSTQIAFNCLLPSPADSGGLLGLIGASGHEFKVSVTDADGQSASYSQTTSNLVQLT
jgi:type II secretory pathway pseudopilin PulG